MQQWQYCIFTAYETSDRVQFTISYPDRVDKPQTNNRLEVLAELGREGWELVAVHPLAAGLNEYYFKRASHFET
jgi:hypothetical protein